MYKGVCRSQHRYQKEVRRTPQTAKKQSKDETTEQDKTEKRDTMEQECAEAPTRSVSSKAPKQNKTAADG